jgi:hypothetical protein
VSVSTDQTRWRASGPYLPTLASKAALFEETRLFLITYGQQRDLATTKRTLVNTILTQRSHRTRLLILDIIIARLVRWHPPIWVLHDLVAFANESSPEALQAALLLHITRQDHLLYDFLQIILVARAHSHGDQRLTPADAQAFFDTSEEAHSEIAHWSFETRLRLARGLLATLRDCGLLKGEIKKTLTLPVIPSRVVHHLILLLEAEGIPRSRLADHSDWQLWLWSPIQAQIAIEAFFKQRQAV